MRIRPPLRLRAAAAALAALAGLALLPAALDAQQPAPAPRQGPPAGTGRLIGLIVDSVHVRPLVGATVHLRQTLRFGETNPRGIFVIDSIAPGEYVANLSHALLDSLYLSVATPPVRIVADSVTEMVLVIPSLASLIGSPCPPATMNLGPAVFGGRVMDTETRQPAAGVRVTLLWTGLSVGTDIGVRRTPRVRTAVTDAKGYYRICGVPDDLQEATVQAERGRVKTAEVPVSIRGLFGLRSLLVRPAGDTLSKTGSGVVTGRVVDTVGAPVVAAQVSVEGAAPVALTNERGEYRLDSLPAGTQALVIRKIGLAPSNTIIDLLPRQTLRVAQVQLQKAVPVLQGVVVTARAEALSRVGFEDRQKRGMGRYLGPDDLARMNPIRASEAFRTIPGIRVVPTSGGRYALTSTRDPQGGCMNYWVDGAPFREMEPGDLDMSFPGSEITAIEVYQPTDTPAQFSTAGQSSCMTIVIWTQASIRRKARP